MAQSAPGWCERSLGNPLIERFVSQTCVFDTKRSIEAFQVIPQTTPVSLRGTSPPDLRRGARKTSNLRFPGERESRWWLQPTDDWISGLRFASPE
jgi:CHASE1-domain containing sensor protein